MSSAFTIAWLLVIMILGPVAGVLGARRVAISMPPRKAIYLANAANLFVLGAITAGIDLWRGAPALALFGTPLSGGRLAGWIVATALGALAIWFGVALMRVRLQQPPKPTVIRMLPQTGAEKAAFALLCLLIGSVEEYLYRGFSLLFLSDCFDSGMPAVILVSVSFALMHGIQDRIAIANAFFQGLLFAMPVVVEGSLIPSVVAHAVVDMASGLALLPVLRSLGMAAAALETGGNV